LSNTRLAGTTAAYGRAFYLWRNMSG
jgi:hypothetical protein